MTHQYMEIKIKELEKRIDALEKEHCEYKPFTIDELEDDDIKKLLRLFQDQKVLDSVIPKQQSCENTISIQAPINEELWKVIENAELDNTNHIWFTTPSGKRVDFIKADALNKIIDEVYDIDDKIVLNPDSLYERKAYVRLGDVIDSINKYKIESEE